MNIKQIHHVAIIASDYQVSKHFYTEILGLAVIRETYRKERDSYMLDLQLGNSQIELFSFPNPPQRPTSPEATGLRHLCFQADFSAALSVPLLSRLVSMSPRRTLLCTRSDLFFHQHCQFVLWGCGGGVQSSAGRRRTSSQHPQRRARPIHQECVVRVV